MAYNRKIKVGSDVISSLKSMGMKEAVRYANSLSNTKGNAELLEGARRLYGSRIKAASTAPKYKSADSARSGSVNKNATATFKSVDSARAAVARGVNASSRGGTASQALKAMTGNKTVKKSTTPAKTVTVKDTRPGATGSTTFKTSSVNATRKKTAATKVTAKDKKKVSTVASWRY